MLGIRTVMIRAAREEEDGVADPAREQQHRHRCADRRADVDQQRTDRPVREQRTDPQRVLEGDRKHRQQAHPCDRLGTDSAGGQSAA